MNFQVEKTVDIFEHAPKLIAPQVHRWIDIAAASAFAIVGGFFSAAAARLLDLHRS